jgi:predicted 3-demethylubiquinone-9 3-methyltransferase (glyoxalase superfamily)
MMKIASCIWYDGTAEAAATFYAATFPDSHVDAGDVLTVEFAVFGMAFLEDKVMIDGVAATRMTRPSIVAKSMP